MWTEQQKKEFIAIRDLALEEWNRRLIAAGKKIESKSSVDMRYYNVYPKFLKDFLVSKGLWPRWTELKKQLKEHFKQYPVPWEKEQKEINQC